VRVPDTGTGTRAGYHATDAHGFPCTSLSQNRDIGTTVVYWALMVTNGAQ